MSGLREIRSEIGRIELSLRIIQLELWHARFERALLRKQDYDRARRIADAAW